MVLSFFSGGKPGTGGVSELIARKKYDKAIELLRAEFKGGSRDPRLRLQLADVMVMAGKGRDAVPILLGLADEFALDGFAAKAISVLKKVQKIDPKRSEVEVKLAKLIKQKVGESATASRPAASFGMEEEEIGMDMPSISSAGGSAPVSADPGPAVEPAAPSGDDLKPAGLAEFQQQAEELQHIEIIPDEEPPAAPAESDAGGIDSLGDELLGVIEDVLRSSPPPSVRAAHAAPAQAQAAESPLFSSFSQDELVAVIKGLRLLSFEPGDIVITEGEPGSSLFVLTSGDVKAFIRDPQGHSKQVREMNEGAFFGEISILSGKPRTATITAKTPCDLLELDRATLDSISATHPHVREVLQQFYDQRMKNEQEQKIRAGKS